MQGKEDVSLVSRAAVFHDKRAFGQLVVKYQSPIRRFFLTQTLGDAALSDDLAQDTFVKAYTHIDKFRGESSFGTWLYRIAYNCFYDYAKSNRQTGSLDTVSVRKRSASAVDGGLRMDLKDALAILTPSERTCIVLQLMDGQSIDKISEITGMVEGTIKSHLSRGKKKMANFLRANGYDG